MLLIFVKKKKKIQMEVDGVVKYHRGKIHFKFYIFVLGYKFLTSHR